MNIFIMIYMAILFFVLTPNIFVTLPDALDTTSKYTVAGVHAGIFAIVFYLTYSQIKENFGTNWAPLIKATSNLLTGCSSGRAKINGRCI